MYIDHYKSSEGNMALDNLNRKIATVAAAVARRSDTSRHEEDDFAKLANSTSSRFYQDLTDCYI